MMPGARIVYSFLPVRLVKHIYHKCVQKKIEGTLIIRNPILIFNINRDSVKVLDTRKSQRSQVPMNFEYIIH